jgi:hypothetical protein
MHAKTFGAKVVIDFSDIPTLWSISEAWGFFLVARAWEVLLRRGDFVSVFWSK